MSDVHKAYESPTEPPDNTRKSGFRLRDLFVVMAIVGLLAMFLIPAPRASREAARRMSCGNSLKQIALAMGNYHEVYDQFPPAYIADERGKPMHSWRVLLLPFLEQQALYEQYRFDEPWDGPNNRLLSDQIPGVYRCPSYRYDREHHHDGTEDDEQLTQYVALVGAETVFSPGEAIRLADITDGTEDTLVVVEIHAECVHWMSPRDVGPEKFIELLDSGHAKDKHHPGGLQAATADGAVEFLPETTEAERIRGRSSRAGGEEAESPDR